MLSNAELMKSANCISTTGRSPISAMPAAMPVKPSSASGVFITRSGPNSADSPLVTLNAPPKSPADILAQQEHVRVAAHLLGQRLVDGGEVGEDARCGVSGVLVHHRLPCLIPRVRQPDQRREHDQRGVQHRTGRDVGHQPQHRRAAQLHNHADGHFDQEGQPGD